MIGKKIIVFFIIYFFCCLLFFCDLLGFKYDYLDAFTSPFLPNNFFLNYKPSSFHSLFCSEATWLLLIFTRIISSQYALKMNAKHLSPNCVYKLLLYELQHGNNSNTMGGYPIIFSKKNSSHDWTWHFSYGTAKQ